MKTDIIIANETKHVAHMVENNREYYLLKLFHEMLLCPKICTKDMVSNIATILMDENLSDTYLKYAN